ncbi:hypothetical protein IMSAGC007_03062 [Lachnospiraceae bacterium]|nr:hypothetical protein IMSAGC007_03062 [Lachnospiraceae bacterium]
MLFIGYSSKDRYDIVEPMIFHLKNYGIDVWYDFHDMYLSDNRIETNFINGIGKSTYVIFIISNNLFTSQCAIEELKYAQDLYEKGDITLFPILYLLKASEVPEEYNWIKKIIYNEVTKNSGTLFVTNQIIEKILHDECSSLQYRSFSEISDFMEPYLKELLEVYLMLDTPNYSAKMALLYAAYLYISFQKNIQFETYIVKIIKRIITFSSLNITLDHLSYHIFELTILISLNKYLIRY